MPRRRKGVARVRGALQGREVVQERRSLAHGLLLDTLDGAVPALDFARNRLGGVLPVEAAAVTSEPAPRVVAARRAEEGFDLEVVFGDEVRNLRVALDDECERRRLHAPQRVDALVARAACAQGLGACGVDADEPVGALSRVRGVAQAAIFFGGLERAEAFENGVARGRRNPEELDGLWAGPRPG